MKCNFCNYEWKSNKINPKQCPKCKRYLDFVPANQIESTIEMDLVKPNAFIKRMDNIIATTYRLTEKTEYTVEQIKKSIKLCINSISDKTIEKWLMTLKEFDYIKFEQTESMDKWVLTDMAKKRLGLKPKNTEINIKNELEEIDKLNNLYIHPVTQE